MTHDEMIAVIQHHRDGGKIEVARKVATNWKSTLNPCWDFSTFDYSPKPEPMKIYAEICEKNGILMRTSKERIDRIYSGTIIKTFIEAND